MFAKLINICMLTECLTSTDVIGIVCIKYYSLCHILFIVLNKICEIFT